MAKITYVRHDGEARTVEVESGLTVMEGALDNEIEGIEAECGGCCSCATCHVFVDPEWIDRLPERDELEVEMLQCTACDRQSTSRLSCQIEVDDNLDGLVVHLPEFQS